MKFTEQLSFLQLQSHLLKKFCNGKLYFLGSVRCVASTKVQSSPLQMFEGSWLDLWPSSTQLTLFFILFNFCWENNSRDPNKENAWNPTDLFSTSLSMVILFYFIFLECQDLMRNGTKVLKISFLENGKKNVSKKTLLLDEDKASIRYQPTKKGITFKSKSFEEQKQPFSDVPQKCAYSTPTLLRNRRRHRYSRANFEKLYTIAFSWNTFQ